MAGRDRDHADPGSEHAPEPSDISEHHHTGRTAHGEVVAARQRGERVVITAPYCALNLHVQFTIGGQAGANHRDPRLVSRDHPQGDAQKSFSEFSGGLSDLGGAVLMGTVLWWVGLVRVSAAPGASNGG